MCCKAVVIMVKGLVVLYLLTPTLFLDENITPPFSVVSFIFIKGGLFIEGFTLTDDLFLKLFIIYN